MNDERHLLFSARGKENQTEAAKVDKQELNLNAIKTVVHNLRIEEMAVSIKRLQV